MFDSLMARAARTAERRAQEHARRLAAALEAGLPADVAVALEAGGVRLSGRALVRRLVLGSALGWMIKGLVR
jgi:hypothetical protein